MVNDPLFESERNIQGRQSKLTRKDAAPKFAINNDIQEMQQSNQFKKTRKITGVSKIDNKLRIGLSKIKKPNFFKRGKKGNIDEAVSPLVDVREGNLQILKEAGLIAVPVGKVGKVSKLATGAGSKIPNIFKKAFKSQTTRNPRTGTYIGKQSGNKTTAAQRLPRPFTPRTQSQAILQEELLEQGLPQTYRLSQGALARAETRNLIRLQTQAKKRIEELKKNVPRTETLTARTTDPIPPVPQRVGFAKPIPKDGDLTPLQVMGLTTTGTGVAAGLSAPFIPSSKPERPTRPIRPRTTPDLPFDPMPGDPTGPSGPEETPPNIPPPNVPAPSVPAPAPPGPATDPFLPSDPAVDPIIPTPDIPNPKINPDIPDPAPEETPPDEAPTETPTEAPAPPAPAKVPAPPITDRTFPIVPTLEKEDKKEFDLSDFYTPKDPEKAPAAVDEEDPAPEGTPGGFAPFQDGSKFGELTPPRPDPPPPPPKPPGPPVPPPKVPEGSRRRRKLPPSKTNQLEDNLKNLGKKNNFPSKVQWKQKDKYITYNLNTGKKKEFNTPQGIGVNQGNTPEETLKVIQKKNKRPKFVSTTLGSLQIIVSSPEVVTLKRINKMNNINRRFNFRR
jgi:hypothetical protein